MKKRMAILMTLALLAGTLAGCGTTKQPAEDNSAAPSTENTTAATDNNSQPAAAEAEENKEWSGEVSQVIMTYLTLGNTPADLQMVQDALNERTVKEIGVEVELKAVSAYDAFSQFPTWLATGERIDLMFPLLQNLNDYVNQGLIEPLDQLIAKNAPYIQQLTEEGYTFASNNTIDGQIWAVTQITNVSGAGGSFIIDTKYIEEAGFDYDPARIYTMDELAELFAALKELHPEMYPCGVVSAARTDTEYVYATGVYDALGAKAYTGALLGTDGTTVTNLFETEGYQEYLGYLREWYQAGYIHPDAATTDATSVSLRTSGVSCGYFMVSAPIQADENQSIIRLTQPFKGTVGAGGWTIPLTAEEPEAAMRLLNLMYEDISIANLIQWGIEGVHYEIADESINLITFPEGVDANTSGYYNTLGLYGDFRKIYIWDANQNQAANDAYTAEAMKNPTQGGIIYNPTDAVSVKITALSAVVGQYLPALESGSVDLDTYYPEFISALKAAGIDDVIADKQAQYDKARANQ